MNAEDPQQNFRERWLDISPPPPPPPTEGIAAPWARSEITARNCNENACMGNLVDLEGIGSH